MEEAGRRMNEPPRCPYCDKLARRMIAGRPGKKLQRFEGLGCHDCSARLVAVGWRLECEARIFGRWRGGLVEACPTTEHVSLRRARELADFSRMPRRRPGRWIRVHTFEFGVRFVHASDVRLPAKGPRGGRAFEYPWAQQRSDNR